MNFNEALHHFTTAAVGELCLTSHKVVTGCQSNIRYIIEKQYREATNSNLIVNDLRSIQIVIDLANPILRNLNRDFFQSHFSRDFWLDRRIGSIFGLKGSQIEETYT